MRGLERECRMCAEPPMVFLRDLAFCLKHYPREGSVMRFTLTVDVEQRGDVAADRVVRVLDELAAGVTGEDMVVGATGDGDLFRWSIVGVES